jgi:ABC-type sugar transport system ATPase subunit
MLVVRNLFIQYQGNQVLQGFDLELAQGDIFALLGDSGSGKSSALHFIAGLDEAHNGSVVCEYFFSIPVKSTKDSNSFTRICCSRLD